MLCSAKGCPKYGAGGCVQGLGSRLARPVGNVQPHISAVVVTPVWISPLESGLNCLGFRGCFFPLGWGGKTIVGLEGWSGQKSVEH